MRGLRAACKKMASVVGITFVNESQNFDFEKSGKSFNRRKGKWSWLYKAESGESDVESTENRDASPSDKDVECESTSSESESFESASSESVSSESVNSESESYPSEDKQMDETGKDVSKTKNKSADKRKPAKKPNSGTSRNTKQSKNTLGRRTNSNAMTNEELEDLCFELDEKKEELFGRFVLQVAG